MGRPLRSWGPTATIAPMAGRITRWLDRAPPAAFSAYAIAAAFGTYFCMYAFRKPVGAATFEGRMVGEIEFKIALLTVQVIGYALSKFLGIKFVTELSPSRRASALLTLVGIAELALLGVAVLPPGGKLAAIFVNGLMLGAVWGLVFGFLEGRRTSEILGAGLSTSYIVASGGVKTVGRWWMGAGVPEDWMPFVTGLCFAPVFVLCVWMLRQIPRPSEADVEARTQREPMDGPARRRFFAQFSVGLIALTALYTLLTAYRDFRDNFAAELWEEMGLGEEPLIFTASELPVALAVMLALALVYRIADNRRAFLTVHGIMLGGTAMVGLSTLAFDLRLLGPVPWMIAVGTGLYLAYVPYGCVLFDRLIAATGAAGTAVFMIYVTDAFGYAGSIAVMLYRNFGEPDLSWLAFFRGFSYLAAVFCSAAFVVSMVYFSGRTRAAARSA